MLFRSEHVNKGLACLRQAVVENDILYLIIDDDEIYRIRYLKEPEMVAYLINKLKSEGNKGDTV